MNTRIFISQVVTHTTPLSRPLVGVTSMGLGSSFGHAVLRQHDKVKSHVYAPYEMYKDGLPRLITISGRTEAGLRDILKKVGEIGLVRVFSCRLKGLMPVLRD